MSRRNTAAVSFGVLFVWSLATGGTPAGAAITTGFSHGTLVISGTERHDDIVIACSAGRVQLNGTDIGDDVIDGNGGYDRMYAYLLGDASLLDGTLVTTDNGTDTFFDIETVTLDSNSVDLTLDAFHARFPRSFGQATTPSSSAAASMTASSAVLAATC